MPIWVEPLTAAIDLVRSHDEATRRPIVVAHVDVPGNDWASLFALAADDAHSYRRDDKVFTLGAGADFYRQVLPGGCVSLGWCSTAVHWLPAPPGPLDHHLFACLDAGEQGAQWRERAAVYWKGFLACRHLELDVGGQLVVTAPLADPLIEPFFELLERSVSDLVADGVLNEDEARRMVIPMYHRNASEMVDPADSPQAPFSVEEYDEVVVPDPAYQSFTEHGDAGRFASDAVVACRAWIEPSLLRGLDPGRMPHERTDICEKLYHRLGAQVAATPSRARFDWRTALLRLTKVGHRRSGTPG